MTDLPQAAVDLVPAKDGQRLERAFFFRARGLPIYAAVFMLCQLCAGTTGLYFGSVKQADKNAAQTTELQQQIKDERIAHEANNLKYEQRLGTQSAAYADSLGLFKQSIDLLTKTLTATQQNVTDLSAQLDETNRRLDRANARALAEARKAATAASTTLTKSDQILAKQTAVQQQVTEVASAARATEKKLDAATRPPKAARQPNVYYNGN